MRFQIVEQKDPSSLEFVTTFELPPTPTKPTVECFTGWRYHYRSSDLDHWLPEVQKGREGGASASHRLIQPMATFKEVVEALLGEEGSIESLAQLLIHQGHTFTLTEIEFLTECTDAGKETGLCIDGRGNLFPVRSTRGDVSVADVRRPLSGGRWDVFLSSLESDEPWREGSCFFSRVDTQTS